MAWTQFTLILLFQFVFVKCDDVNSATSELNGKYQLEVTNILDHFKSQGNKNYEYKTVNVLDEEIKVLISRLFWFDFV